MQNLFTRARAAHQARINEARQRELAHFEAKRVEVLSHTIGYAQANLGITLQEDEIVLETCREPNHPNVYGATYFWSEGLLFKFLPWSASWSVSNDSGGDNVFHPFRDLADLGKVLLHSDFAHLTAETSEGNSDDD